MKLLLAPHNDDECLWTSFTIMRERPVVMVVFDSLVQPSRGVPGCDAQTRRGETIRAMSELVGSGEAIFLGKRDDQVDSPDELAAAIRAALAQRNLDADLLYPVWAPAYEKDGHVQHNLVALATDLAYPGKVEHYLTYTRSGGKSRDGVEVLPRSGDDIARKLRALACYTSQLQIDGRIGCYPHFLNDLREYYLT